MNRYTAFIFILLLIVPIMGGLYSCRSTSESLLDPSTVHAYRIGFPEVKARAGSFFDDDGAPVIDLHLEFPIGSLITRTVNGQPEALIGLQVAIRNTDDPLIGTTHFNDELHIKTGKSSEISHFYSRRFASSPGEHEIELQVKDQISDKTTLLKLMVIVPDPASPMPSISDIRVALMRPGENQVVSSYMIPRSADSLSFGFFVTRPSPDLPVSLTLRLIRFKSDTQFPRPMSMSPVSMGSLAYRGIDYSDQTTIISQQRVLDDETGSILVELREKVPEHGNFRFEITLETVNPKGNKETTVRFRDFTMVSPNFPEIKTTEELVRPLYYLMTTREYRRITSIENPDSLRLAFEEFWLSNLRDRNRAREVIELYYSRVEEANRLFTSFREGWSTDMGMIFILFGPPVHVETGIDHEVWYYSYNRMDPRMVMRFDRARVMGDSFPFRHYVLVRQRFYYEIEYATIQEWLSGNVLMRR